MFVEFLLEERYGDVLYRCFLLDGEACDYAGGLSDDHVLRLHADGGVGDV